MWGWISHMVVDEFQVWSDIDLHKIKEISRWIKRENVFTVNSSAHSCRLWRAWNGQDYRKGRRQWSPSNLASVLIGFSEPTTLLIADLDFENSKKVILQICQPEVVLAFKYETSGDPWAPSYLRTRRPTNIPLPSGRPNGMVLWWENEVNLNICRRHTSCLQCMTFE